MSTRKIKNARDLESNELIYFKSHAQATFMSDGSTVEDVINEIKETGGTDLTDYVTTTQLNTSLSGKQDTISDLADIRSGASKGTTSVQPDDISEFITAEDVATVATSGSYEDLIDKPVYITDFDVLSLYDLAQNPNEVGGIQSDNQAIEEALAANKIVLVPYAIGDDGVRGYATLVGYAEDLLYFKVIADNYEIYVETQYDRSDIRGQEVILRSWRNKQDLLVSGTNIKTINGNSILGSGDIEISSGSSSDANVQAVNTGDVIDDVNVEYATKTYVDGLVGDINSILESIING